MAFPSGRHAALAAVAPVLVVVRQTERTRRLSAVRPLARMQRERLNAEVELERDGVLPQALVEPPLPMQRRCARSAKKT